MRRLSRSGRHERRWRRRVSERSRIAHRLADRRLRRSRRGSSPDPVGHWALAGLVAGSSFLVLIAIFVSSLDLTGEDAPAAQAPDSAPSVRAVDRARHVSFRRTGRSLTIKLGDDAPAATRAARGSTVTLRCAYLRPIGSGLYERRLGWPAGTDFNTLNLPAEVAVTLQSCALRRNSRTLARARFRG